MDTLAKRIRAAAKKQAIGVEALRVRANLSPDTFYKLLRGESPKTLKTLRKLSAAGVSIPESLLRAA